MLAVSYVTPYDARRHSHLGRSIFCGTTVSHMNLFWGFERTVQVAPGLQYNPPRSHPVCRRPTHRGAGAVPGVQVERPTGRTTWTPGAVSARLCLGRRQTGWESPPPHPPAGTRPRSPRHPGA